MEKPAKELQFNLAVDPGEPHDLCAQHPEKLVPFQKLQAARSKEVDADCRRPGIILEPGPPRG